MGGGGGGGGGGGLGSILYTGRFSVSDESLI